MPITFDPLVTKSPHGLALWKTGDLLANAPLFWELSETNILTADEKITIGISAEPDDREDFKVPDLQVKFCLAQVFPPIPSQDVIQQNDGSPTPFTGGAVEVWIRRIARNAEVDTHAKKNDLFLAFYDHICGIENWLQTESERLAGCPNIVGIEPVVQAAWNAFDEESAQGEYLWAKFMVQWGDIETE